MPASTPEQRKQRYMANPRRCVDCGGESAAGHPRCTTCHQDHLTRVARGEQR